MENSPGQWLENPVYFSLAGRYTFAHSSQGCSRMTLYGYARVSVREPEDKNLDLQVERLVRAGCSLGNTEFQEQDLGRIWRQEQSIGWREPPRTRLQLQFAEPVMLRLPPVPPPTRG